MLENNPAFTLAESEELQGKAMFTFIAEQYHYSGADVDDPQFAKLFGEEFGQYE